MKKYPLRLAFIYFVVSTAWIFVSDWVIAHYVATPNYNRVQNIKGFGFVTLSAIGLYFLVRSYYKQLEASEKVYRQLFKDNPHPMWVYDPISFEFLTVNQSAIEKYGYTKAEFLKLKITDIRPDTEVVTLMDFVRNIDNKIYADSGVWQHKTKAGEKFFVKIASHATLFNGRHARVVLAMDIEKQIQAQKALQVSESKLNGLINNSDDLIWLLDKSGTIITANEAFVVKMRQVLGITIDTSQKMDVTAFPVNGFTRKWTEYFLKAIKGESPKVEGKLVDPNPEICDTQNNPRDESKTRTKGSRFCD